MPDYPPKNKKRELLEALKNKVGEAELSERGSMGLFVTTLEEMGMKGKAYRVKVGADVSLEGFEELKYDYYIVVGNLPLSFGMGRGDEGKVITMEGSLTISPDQLQHMLVQGTAQECTEECLQAYRKERPKQN